MWSWPGNNPFRWRDPYGRHGWEDFGDDFYKHSESAADGLLVGSTVLLNVATLGAAWEVGAALGAGRLALGSALRLGAAGALRGALLGGGAEAGKEEVHDGPGDNDLPSKWRAQLAGSQRLPKAGFRLRRRLSHSVSARFKKLLTTQLVECGHVASERLAWGRVQRPPSAGSATRAKP